MGHNNGYITAPVNTDDVSAVLGVNSHDVRTLCTHERINMWATYKPEALGSSPAPITLAQRKANNFGIAIGTEYTGANIVSSIKSGTFHGGWRYTRLGDLNYARLTDFVSEDGKSGYDHNAMPPFPVLYPGSELIGSDIDTVITCGSPFVTTDGTNLALKDFSKSGVNYSSWYFCILLVNDANTIVATGNNPLSSLDGWQVNLGKINISKAGEYTAVPLLTDRKIAAGGVIVTAAKFIGLASTGVKIKLGSKSDMYPLALSCEYSVSKHSVKYKVSIFNDSSTAKTFTTPTIQIATSLDGSGMRTLISFASQTIAANSKWEETGTVQVNAAFDTTVYKYCRVFIQGHGNSAWQAFAESFTWIDPIPLS